MVITRAPQLLSLVDRLRDQGSFALDTEFERERSYWPKLQLIQVGIPGEIVAIDPHEIRSLTPLYELITDPNVEKVTHAGRQDAEIFYTRIGSPPANFYDTQIAAALVGMGEQVGYANLVQRLLQVRLKKTERITDWGRRPLSEAQVSYALDDVRYLLDVKELLDKELEALGRTEWLVEELAFYADPEFYDQEPAELWMRVSGWRSLDRLGLTVLRELAKWRENEACARDAPRNRVTADDVLVEIAARQPKRISDLTPLRRLHPREIERNGNAILKAVKTGMEVPESDMPVPRKAQREDPESALIADLMSLLLRKRARESKVAPSYVGNQKAVSALVQWLASGRNGELPRLMSGWRKQLVGDELLALYEGKVSLKVDPESRRISAD
jgi:ribonuclease D